MTMLRRDSVVRRTIATPIILSALILALAVFTFWYGSRPFNQTVIDVLLRVMLVVGLYIFIGNSGVLSFGHIGFTCLGAYAAAWLTMPPMMKGMMLPGLPGWLIGTQLPYWVAAPIAATFAAFFALLFGLVLMRLSGIAASIATFAMLAMINKIYSNWSSVTGATSSVVGIPIVRDLWPYVIAVILCIFIAWAHAISRAGLKLRAARDEPVAAQASGIDIPRERLVAFVVSGWVTGLAGALFAHSLGVVTPDTFYLAMTFMALSMLVVGGMSSLSGAVLGVLVLSLLIQMLRALERGVDMGGIALKIPNGMQEIALGVIMIAILMFRPSGMMGNRELVWPRARRGRVADAATPSSTTNQPTGV